MHNDVACTWGSLFEPLVRRYFEQKHSVSVFISLSLTVEIAFKCRKQAIKYQCWCGVSSLTVVILLTLKF